MPTDHRRIGVTRDPELDEALERTAPLLTERSAAARVRALALAGARALIAGGDAADQRFEREHGLRPARHRRPLRAPRGQVSTAATEALEWSRGAG